MSRSARTLRGGRLSSNAAVRLSQAVPLRRSRLRRSLRRAGYDDGSAQVWAFHPYVAGNTPDDRRLNRFLDGTRRTSDTPKVWFSEQGGILNSKNFPNRDALAAQRAGDRLIGPVVNLDVRVTRFYYYSLHGDPPPKFDSGLLDFNNVERPMFADYKAKINP